MSFYMKDSEDPIKRSQIYVFKDARNTPKRQNGHRKQLQQILFPIEKLNSDLNSKRVN